MSRGRKGALLDYVDATGASVRLNEIRDAGGTMTDVAFLTGISLSMLSNIVNWKTAKVSDAFNREIMALTVERVREAKSDRARGVEPKRQEVMVDAAPRIAILERFHKEGGYRQNQLAEALGVRKQAVQSLLWSRPKRMHTGLARRIDALTVCDLEGARHLEAERKKNEERRRRLEEADAEPRGYANVKTSPVVHRCPKPRPEGRQWIVWQEVNTNKGLARWGTWERSRSEAVRSWNGKLRRDGFKYSPTARERQPMRRAIG